MTLSALLVLAVLGAQPVEEEQAELNERLEAERALFDSLKSD
ncbi:MAG: hypothetical protein H6Q89_4453, partial [Myxococcaceae bacterium]|nr:hypothetical protein [Myxococcaceae bacterium]